MSNNRGRFPGRPLSARRHKIRQRLTESDINRSSVSSEYKEAQQILRGLKAFRNTFNLQSPTQNLSGNTVMVRNDS